MFYLCYHRMQKPHVGHALGNWKFLFIESTSPFNDMAKKTSSIFTSNAQYIISSPPTHIRQDVLNSPGKVCEWIGPMISTTNNPLSQLMFFTFLGANIACLPMLYTHNIQNTVNYFYNCSTIINIHRVLVVVNFIGQMNP